MGNPAADVPVPSGRPPRVVVCRALAQAGPLNAALAEIGVDVVALPLVEVVDPLDPTPLGAAVAELDRYDWVTFTSTNAVDAVASRLGEPWPATVRIAVVGRATAAAVRSLGWEVAEAPERSTAADLAGHLAATHPAGRLLAPVAELGGDDLDTVLGAAGWEVARVEAYRTITPSHDAATLAAASAADVVCITAGSIAERLVEVLDGRRRPAAVCIGPSSETAARAVGLDVVAVADPHDTDGLVAAVARSLDHPTPGHG